MKAKITLTLDDAVIEQAKIYAEEQGISLDEFIENCFKSLIDEHNDSETVV
ncbi:DUF6364 family protein [Pedobacter soli]|uniref:Ribbon-helix-helix protein, copG family n=1 Tax=Pedobacter soli TaxID=390242 RepID=A0A1G6NBP0_9SPHI|nr:DUF6364 family protein [Pedobacter soli]SDC64824.1 hypothetical protein SAMN04488024_102617 [Pedobacter soli]